MTVSGINSRGVTLVELVITIVIMSIALLAVVSVYSKAIERSADPLIFAKATELAQTYLDEILTKRYDEATPVGGVPAAQVASLSATLGADAGETTRADYDDVDDFNGQTYSTQAFITGGNFTQYVNYQIAIAVSYAGTAVGATHNQHVKRIDITVSTPLSAAMTFSAYKGNF